LIALDAPHAQSLNPFAGECLYHLAEHANSFAAALDALR